MSRTLPSPAVRHLAVIMDGNGRWAVRRGLRRVEGHRAGAAAVRRVVRQCVKRGIPYLTLYAFSTENFGRPKAEVSALMDLLRRYLAKELPRFIAEGIRLKILGDPGRLPADIAAGLEQAVARTARGRRLTLCIALAYGGREEIVRAAARWSAARWPASERAFAAALDTAGLPDPDLLIRTGGEMRVSNFLLWQLAYTELYFTRVLWPDFGGRQLGQALRAFAARRRRFGKLAPD